jgi:DNA primase
MKYEKMDFPEAVRFLAKKAGIELPKSTEEQKNMSLNLQIYRINELATNFYQKNLFEEEARGIREYLLKRSISEESIRKFRLGFAKDSWDGLLNFLRQSQIPLSLIEKSGLIIPKEGGGYYDRFRKRIIFPIFDIRSRVIGFGARKLEDDVEDLPKYINSPETPIYIKGRNLYGLNFAKDSIRKEDRIVIVEGYTDFIIPFQEGFRSICASMGVALTLEQIRLLKRFTHNIVIVFDSDRAGELATLRSLDLFLEENMNVRIFSLPEGFDPDSFVREFGIQDFKEGIDKAKSLYEYKLDLLKSKFGLESLEAKSKIAAEMLVTISKFSDSVLKSGYLKKLSEELDIEEEALRIELKKIKQIPSYQYKEEILVKPKLDITPTERLLLKVILDERELLEKIRGRLDPYDFTDSRLSKVVTTMLNLLAEGKNISINHLISNFKDDEEITSLLCELSLSQESMGEDPERVINDCLRSLKMAKLKARQKQISELIKIAQNNGDEEKLKELVKEFNSLTRKVNSLKEV